MELDETDPAVWLKLETATHEYVQSNSESFKMAIKRLMMPFQHEDKLSENLKPHNSNKTKVSESGRASMQ